MASSKPLLRTADWRTLDLIGAALATQYQEKRIEFRQVVGWPFAWLLHPGIEDGLVVADTRVVYRLQQADLIHITQPAGDDVRQFLCLTRSGQTLASERAQAKRPTDLSLATLDDVDGVGWQ